MKIVESNIPEIKIIEPDIYADKRGYFLESFRSDLFKKNGIETDFVQDNISKSSRGTLRGLHYQKEQPQAKLIKCIYGAILDVAVDIRTFSKTFAQYVSVELSEHNHKQIYVPEGFAHGFYVKSEEAIISYKVDAFYNKNSEIVINAMDPRLNLNLNKNKFIFSDRDLLAPNFDKIIF